MKTFFGLFRIASYERKWTLCALLLLVLLHGLCLYRYAGEFAQPDIDYRQLFLKHFLVSGFDPITYQVISQWDYAYNIVRHPLLPYFVYPLYLLNQGLMWVFGVNCAMEVVAVAWLLIGIYTFVLLLRLFHEVLELGIHDAGLLAMFTFSMAYVMLSALVPDHFLPSMFMLVLTLYIAGKMHRNATTFAWWQTALLFVFTAGISLNNGVKTLMAAFFTNGKRFFKPWHLIAGVVIPVMMLVGIANVLVNTYERPRQKARQAAIMAHAAREHARIDKAFRDTTHLTDSIEIKKAVQRIINKKAWEKYREDHKKPWNAHTGKPFAKQSYLSWTDSTTPRVATLVENVFGESLLLHEDYLLGDTLKNRPVIVHYRFWGNYAVTALVVALFVAGIWAGRRSKLLWTALSFFLFDMFIHLALGFGINEIYIMSAHWLFIMPLAMAFLFKDLKGKRQHALRWTTALLTLYFMVWNLVLLTNYFVFYDSI